MANEFVVNFRDTDNGRELKLDINNGYLYDLQGNQVAKWDPVDSSTEEIDRVAMCADYVADRYYGIMREAAEAPMYTASVLAKLGGGASADKLIAEDRRLSMQAERAITMDLGTADVHLPAALPNFAGGYRQFAPVADMAAPPVLVPNPADKYFIFDKGDAFQVAAPIVGAAGGQPAEIPPRLANQTFTTTEYALGGFVATQLDAAADAPLRLRQATMKRILNNLMIRREQRVANLVTNSSNWNSNNVSTLGAGFQWDGGGSSDPIKDIHTRMEQSLGDITGIIMPEPVWHAFQRNPAVQKFFTYKQGAAPLPDAQSMSAILELPPIYVARMKILAPVGGALSFLWGTSAVLIRQPDQMPPTSQDDIASAYTFRWNVNQVPDKVGGMGFASSQGFVVREFFNQLRGTMGGSQMVVLHHDAEVMTSQYVGGLIAGAFQ